MGYWARVASIALGAWLMAAPEVLGHGAPAATMDRVAGPVAMSFAAVAISQATRPLRWGNVVVGAGLVVAPVFLAYPLAAAASSVVTGIALAVLAIPQGPLPHRIGGGWRAIARGGEP